MLQSMGSQRVGHDLATEQQSRKNIFSSSLKILFNIKQSNKNIFSSSLVHRLCF